MKLRFVCPDCEREAQVQVPGPTEWQCPHCDSWRRIPASLTSADLTVCPLCGNHELYKKKDFPHGFGLTILTVACVTFFLAQHYYHPWIAWFILIGSALLDGGLYLWVGDAIVCYRCGAHYHGLEAGPGHHPFELGIGERYRQERLRREQLKREEVGEK